MAFNHPSNHNNETDRLKIGDSFLYTSGGSLKRVDFDSTLSPGTIKEAHTILRRELFNRNSQTTYAQIAISLISVRVHSIGLEESAAEDARIALACNESQNFRNLTQSLYDKLARDSEKKGCMRLLD